MKRSSLLGLREPRWISVDGDPDLQIKIIPSAAAETSALLFAPTDERVIRRICTKLFVDFQGYFEDNGEAIQNSLAARVELYGWGPVARAIANECDKLMNEVAQGEGSAGSD